MPFSLGTATLVCSLDWYHMLSFGKSLDAPAGREDHAWVDDNGTTSPGSGKTCPAHVGVDFRVRRS